MEQKQYLLAYALIGALVFLGYLVVCIPRPRKKAYASEEAQKEALKEKITKKKRAKSAKQNAKRKKKRAKAKAKR